MGSSDIKKQGYPKSHVKRDWELFLFCGGRGGGACYYPTGVTSVKYSVDVNPFIVYNQSLLLLDTALTYPIQFFTDGGAGGLCAHTAGTEVNWYLGLSTDGNLTDAQIIAQNNVLHGAPPYNIEVLANKLPQPTSATWQNKIWIHIFWGDPTYVSAINGISSNVQYLKIIKHNYEVKQ